VLQSILAKNGTNAPRVPYSEHFDDGAALYAHASNLGLEGVVSKRAEAPYRSGRGEHWVKVKCGNGNALPLSGSCQRGLLGY
jgi:bifunctional non-homologous end joining protein LigD